jgi:outer membrane protein assembly factor BamE|tara:strand:- start:1415 stop:1693 length:279 start_codon:yes stop_codon:yes gene_type:complete
MVDKLKPGMSRNQVRYILGNAIVNNTLNEDRWDYVYDIKIGATGDRVRRRLSLFFSEDRLTHFEGDYKPTSEYRKEGEGEEEEQEEQTAAST